MTSQLRKSAPVRSRNVSFRVVPCTRYLEPWDQKRNNNLSLQGLSHCTFSPRLNEKNKSTNFSQGTSTDMFHRIASAVPATPFLTSEWVLGDKDRRLRGAEFVSDVIQNTFSTIIITYHNTIINGSLAEKPIYELWKTPTVQALVQSSNNSGKQHFRQPTKQWSSGSIK